MIPRFQEIHIENTNSCGYKCVMCPRESHTRKLGFMSMEDFSLLLEKIGPFSGTVHLHGFGEPLLDRRLVEKIALLKKKNPAASTLIFSTLGVRLADKYFTQLLEAGLDEIVISLYGFSEEEYKNVHGFNGLALVKKNLESLSRAMKSMPTFQASIKIPSGVISSSLPVAPSAERVSFCRWAQTLGFSIGQWGYVHNYGDGRQYNAPENERVCPVIKGMRKEILNITWDLKVIPCSYDYNGTIPFGDLREQSLEEIFSSPSYLSFVIAHQTGDLSNYPVCQNCEKYDYE